ncbi:MAG: amino acid ABC transporter permease [Peptostreptococcaceae bacterium]
MDFTFLPSYYGYFIEGTKITIIVSLCTLIIGSIIGTIICLGRISKNKLISAVSKFYISFLRGTPLLVQLYIIYFGLPSLGIEFPSFGGISSDYMAAVAALSVNSSAYIAEILRAGIQSIDKGQMEAGRSLGLDYKSSMRYIIIPQALKNVLPALANEFIVLVKESSIISVIGIHDIMYKADIVRGVTYLPFEPLIVAAIIYFILTLSLSKLVEIFEAKLSSKGQKVVSVREQEKVYQTA